MTTAEEVKVEEEEPVKEVIGEFLAQESLNFLNKRKRHREHVQLEQTCAHLNMHLSRQLFYFNSSSLCL